MNESPFFFDNNRAQKLFGVLHLPEHEVSDTTNTMSWVLCHSFAEEKLWAHRVYVSLARYLASQGHTVLRFDYSGYGDSDGEFENSTVDDQLNDISAAIDTLKDNAQNTANIGLIGLRYGALLAAMIAETRKEISHLVLWDPVIDMGKYLQDALRANLTTQMVMHGKVITNRDELTAQIEKGQAVNIDGYDMSKMFFDSANKLNLKEITGSFTGACQLVQIGRPNQPLRKDIESLADNYKNCETIKLSEQQFWKEIKNFVQKSDPLQDALINWLREH
jgi:exosortase A-associated hydrolase 2